MAGGTLASLLVRITADTSGFVKGVSAADNALMGVGNRMQNTGAQMTRTGRSMTKSLSVPLVAAGAAATKLSIDFDKSMTDIRALVGASSQQIDQYRTQVLSMAKDLPQAPKELADALYFVTSSGFEGSEALSVLEASAKAAAAGLGETVGVADAVTSAVNAYGIENLKAAQATDILLATVREGKAEPAELAGVIGRVIPLASEMGVEFHEVGGALAGMSLSGLDAAESTTALRGLLSSILKPSKQAREGFKEMGLDIDSFRRMIAEKGLMPALLELKNRIGDNKDAMGELFPNVRALTGFLNLTGRNAEKNAKVFRELAVATGDTDKAFKEAAKSSGFQLKKAFSNLQAAAIKFGDIIAPVLVDLADKFSGLVDVVSDLPKPVKTVTLKIAALIATAGPLIWLFGKLWSGAGKLVTTFGKLGTATGQMKASVAIAAIAFINAARTFGAAKENAEGFLKTIEDGSNRSISDFKRDLQEVTDSSERMGRKISDAFGAVLTGAPTATQEFNAMRDEANKLQDSLGDMTVTEAKIASAKAELIHATLNQADMTARWGREMAVATGVVDRASTAERNYRDALKLAAVATLEAEMAAESLIATRNRLAGVADSVASAELNVNDAQRTLRDAQANLNAIIESGITKGRRYKEAQDAVKRAQIGLREANRGLRNSIKDLLDNMEAAVNSGKSGKRAFQTLAGALGFTDDQVKNLIKNTSRGTIELGRIADKMGLSKRQTAILHQALELLQSQMGRVPDAAKRELGKLPVIITGAANKSEAKADFMGFLLGQGMSQGIASGVHSGMGWITSAVDTVVTVATEHGKRKLGIKSPSRVWAEIGKQTVQGLIVGMRDQEVALTKQIARMSGTITVRSNVLSGELPAASSPIRENVRSEPEPATVGAGGAKERHVHFHGDTMTDPDKAIRELDWYERTNPW